MGYAAAPRVAFIVYGIQTFFTAIIIIIIIIILITSLKTTKSLPAKITVFPTVIIPQGLSEN